MFLYICNITYKKGDFPRGAALLLLLVHRVGQPESSFSVYLTLNTGPSKTRPIKTVIDEKMGHTSHYPNLIGYGSVYNLIVPY